MSAPRELILASTSSSRREILEATGLQFRSMAPSFEESHPKGASSAEIAEALALGKARSVAERFPAALVIGADQVLEVEGVRLRKPTVEAEARTQLRRLRGRTHQLCTGVALVCAENRTERASHEVTRLTMRSLTDAEIDRYLATGEWRGCLGSFRVEGRGLTLFDRIEGDFLNARGLPMLRLLRMLADLGQPLL